MLRSGDRTRNRSKSNALPIDLLLVILMSVSGRWSGGKDHGIVIFSRGFSSRGRRLYFVILLKTEEYKSLIGTDITINLKECLMCR